AFVNARWNLCGNRFPLWYYSSSLARVTGHRHFSRTITGCTLRSPANPPRLLTGSVTRRTFDGVAPRFSETLACNTDFVSIDLKCFCDSLHRLLERDTEGVLQISAPRRLIARLIGLSFDIAKDLRKDVTEVSCTKISKIEDRSSRAGTCSLLRVITVAVVDLAFPGV